MSQIKNVKEYNIELFDVIYLYNTIKQNFATLKNLQIIYKKKNTEYITENISLDGMRIVDSHTFFKGIELKKVQKQKYNIQDYDILLRLEINTHTYR